MNEWSVIGPVLGALGAIATVALTFSQLKSGFKKEVDSEIKKAVDNARNIADGDIKSFNLRLDGLARDIQNLESKMDQDITHVQAIYNNEIKTLTSNIESLREEVRQQHSQLLNILTKIVTDSK